MSLLVADPVDSSEFDSRFQDLKRTALLSVSLLLTSSDSSRLVLDSHHLLGTLGQDRVNHEAQMKAETKISAACHACRDGPSALQMATRQGKLHGRHVNNVQYISTKQDEVDVVSV